ncbi:MAG: glycerol-3-phosphate 1-O-acyltransferase [Myxococcota bacterium]
MGSETRAHPREPVWPEMAGTGEIEAGARRRLVFLIDGSSPLERRLLSNWVERNRPEGVDSADCELIPIPPSRRRRRDRRVDPRLEASLATGGDPLLAPLRVIWRAALSDGSRSVRFSHLLTFGDPRDPGRIRQHWVLRREPDRCCIVAGEPAPASDLRRRWIEAGGGEGGLTIGLADFVARQAAFALERAERRLRGARYKVPRLVHEEILGRPAFRGELTKLAREFDRPQGWATRSAARILREIAAAHSPYVIDLVAALIRPLYKLGYSETLQYDREQLAGIFSLAQRHPVVFLPSHKSNLDHLVLQYALHENGLPPNHTAGGINMNFFPIGPLIRRSGVFFIRRSFRDNRLYKLVLRSYVDYLIEKRFSLEWYLEGGRSRSGKLLPPRFGLLAYVVDAYRRARSDDVFLIPVSIGYDQIQDVGSYAAEQRGAAKRRESFGWFIGVVRALRRRYGNIHIRFGEPLSLRSQLGPPDPSSAPDPDERNLGLQKVAFEVLARINRVTPITPTSLVALALLGTGDRALSVEETRIAVRNLTLYVERRKLPTTTEIDHLRSDEGVRRTLEALAENGVVSCFADGAEAVYVIGPDQQLTAAYYRNCIVHFFINGAIAELALQRAAETEVDEPAAEFWTEAMRLRDLLKFEFFFAEKEEFRLELRDELAFYALDWEERIGEGAHAIQELVRSFRPFSAHRVLRPFLDSYQVVSENLARYQPDANIEEGKFLAECLTLGKQYHLQRRVRSASSISKVLFQSGLRLAANRKLLAPGDPSLVERRLAFAEEIRAVLRRVDAIDALAASRRAGFIP